MKEFVIQFIVNGEAIDVSTDPDEIIEEAKLRALAKAPRTR